MGVNRVSVRNYTDVVDRIHCALGRSKRLTVLHRAVVASYPLFCLHYDAHPADSPLIYLSAGIHGDEPSGVEVALRIIELLTTLQSSPLDTYSWLISPCDNPCGYERDTRENATGLDLNRMFGNPCQTSETAFIVESLRRAQTHLKTKIDIALDLHEDMDSDGFYLWERRASTTPPIGAEVVQQISKTCAINRKPVIEDHHNKNGVITLLNSVTTKGWTRGRFLVDKINTRCLILETPTALDMETRIETHMVAIQTTIEYTLSLHNH